MEANPPEHLKVVCRGKRIGTSLDVETYIRLNCVSDVTTLDWKGVIAKREGLLKPVSMGVIQAAAQKVISEFWMRFRNAIGSDPDSPSGV